VRRLAALGALALALTAVGCGGSDKDGAADQSKAQVQAAEATTKDKIELLIRERKVPPVARRLINANGTTTVNFIDGPNYDRDVVRTSADGATGKKLAWDLNGDGKIGRAERTITERDLYDATLGPG
jgi:hypothetical protein